MLGSRTPMGVCLTDSRSTYECVHEAPSLSKFLETRGNGAYTVAWLHGSPVKIVDWPLHEGRILRSLSILGMLSGVETSAGTTEKEDHDTSLEPELSSDELILTTIRKHVSAVVVAYQALAAREKMDISAALLVHVTCASSRGQNILSSSSLSPKVSVYCKNYVPPQIHTPVTVAVLGPPRPAAVAHSKYSKWVQERKHLEDIKPQDAAEGLLCDHEGNIMEGLVSNFFVVSDHDDGKGCFLQSSSPSHAALQGIMQGRVLEACHIMGFRVELKPPCVHERHFWKEVFITSCLKGVQPVSKVVCPEGNKCGLSPAWELTLPQPSSGATSITSQIQTEVLKLCTQNDCSF